MKRRDGVEQLLVPRPNCEMCMMPISEDFQETTGVCAACYRGDPVDGQMLESIVAGMAYIPEVTGYPHTQEILDFKHRGAHADAFAEVMMAVLNERISKLTPSQVVPMPSTSLGAPGIGVSRLSDLIATELRVPLLDILRFSRKVETQKSSEGAEARRANIVGSMSATKSTPPGVALIVDDISTTGYSLAEATRALHVAGTTSAIGAVVGRTVRLERLAELGVIHATQS